jgi:hypothetical protein
MWRMAWGLALALSVALPHGVAQAAWAQPLGVAWGKSVALTMSAAQTTKTGSAKAKAPVKAKAKAKAKQVKRTTTKKTAATSLPERTPSGETVEHRERRLSRECRGRPNAGACLGYAQ